MKILPIERSADLLVERFGAAQLDRKVLREKLVGTVDGLHRNRNVIELQTDIVSRSHAKTKLLSGKCTPYFAARPGRNRHSSRNELRSTSGHPLTIFSAYMRADWSIREIIGTSKKFEPRVQPRGAVNRAHNYIAAALEWTRVENLRWTDPINAGGFVDMPRNANVGLHFFDKPARGGAPDRLAAHDSIAFGIERRRMTKIGRAHV